MTQHRVLLLATTIPLVMSASVLGAQGAPPSKCTSYQSPSTSSTGVADQKDVATQDAILAALYDVISGPACQKRDWNRFKSLFVPGARLIPTARPANGPAVARVLTPDEYATNSQRTLEENGFFEKEISRTGETFGARSARTSRDAWRMTRSRSRAASTAFSSSTTARAGGS
jgi:hypothetical protein